MSGTLTILEAGPATTFQDHGRPGFRRYGVSVSGPMDWASHALALRIAGAPHGSVAIEAGPGTLSVRAGEAPVRLGIAAPGRTVAHTTVEGGTAMADAPCGVVLAPGETLTVRAGTGWAYLAVADMAPGEPVLGSLATNARTGLGPPPPSPGMTIPCAKADRAEPLQPFREPLDGMTSPIALLPGPQAHLFPQDMLDRLVGEPYEVTNAVDRMGYRLAGPELLEPGGHDIVSDALVEGAIQVPGNGQPIVLCADRAPTGGYPKIAVVARADLPRLVQSPPGTTLRFAWTSVNEARRRTAKLAQLVDDAAPLTRGDFDSAFLLGCNLIDGVWGVSAA